MLLIVYNKKRKSGYWNKLGLYSQTCPDDSLAVSKGARFQKSSKKGDAGKALTVSSNT